MANRHAQDKDTLTAVALEEKAPGANRSGSRTCPVPVLDNGTNLPEWATSKIDKLIVQEAGWLSGIETRERVLRYSGIVRRWAACLAVQQMVPRTIPEAA